MQKVEGSNPFSRFLANRRLLGAGFLLTAPFLNHDFGHECLETARHRSEVRDGYSSSVTVVVEAPLPSLETKVPLAPA